MWMDGCGAVKNSAHLSAQHFIISSWGHPFTPYLDCVGVQGGACVNYIHNGYADQCSLVRHSNYCLTDRDSPWLLSTFTRPYVIRLQE